MLLRLSLVLSLFVLAPRAARAELDLAAAVEMAMTRNERALEADAAVVGSAARLRRARAAFFPGFSLDGSYTRRAFETVRQVGEDQVTLQSHNALLAVLAAELPLFDARAFSLLDVAELEDDASKLEAREAKRRLSYEAARAYVGALGQEQVQSAARRRLELAEGALLDARARFAAGLVGSNDVTRAELEVGSAERDDRRAHGQTRVAYEELAFLIAARVEGPLVEPTELVELATARPDEPDPIVRAGQTGRLDLRALGRRAEASRAASEEPARRFIPRLGLGGQMRVTNEAGFSGRNYDAFAQVQLSWPIWDGGDRSAESAERAANAAIQDLRAQSAARRIELEVRAAHISLANEQAALRPAGLAVEAARKNEQETRELYRQGLATALSVQDSLLRLFEAEVALARARYSLVLAYLDLRAATGTWLFEEDAAQEGPKE